MDKLTKAPTLPDNNDRQVADHLISLIQQADDGFRRVIKVGLYIEWIAAQLPHGKLIPWIKANAPAVPLRTIYNWRNLAKNLCEWAGIKFAMMANLPVPGDKLLDCPVDTLPRELRACRTKMDEAIGAAPSPRQIYLFLGFKQARPGEDGELQKHAGRRVGEGAPPKPKDMDGALAFRRKIALQRTAKIYRLIQHVAVDIALLPDEQCELLLAQYERHSKAIHCWLNQPKSKRDVEAVRRIWEA